jgi:hypothetical protein
VPFQTRPRPGVSLGLSPQGATTGQAQNFTVVRTVESELLADPFGVLEGNHGVVFESDPISKGIYRVSLSVNLEMGDGAGGGGRCRWGRIWH